MQEIMQFVSRHPVLSIAWIGLLAAVLFTTFKSLTSKIKVITRGEATRLINKEDAVVVDVRQLQHARNERDVPGVERDVDGDPVFEPLVSDEDQDGYDGIPHSGSSLSDQDFGIG